MGTSPLQQYLSNIGFPWYGGTIGKSELENIQRELVPFIERMFKGSIKPVPKYDYILVSAFESWLYMESVTRGYTFGSPHFIDGTRVDQTIDSGKLIESPGIYLCQSGDETVLVLGYVQLKNGKHV